MKKFLALSSIFFSLFVVETEPSKAANQTPYQTVIIASAINFCAAEYGLITDKQAYRHVHSWMKDEHGFEPYQVSNLIQRKSWSNDTSDYIDRVGGCKKIVAVVKEEIARKPYGIKALTNRKKDYEYFYKVDLE